MTPALALAAALAAAPAPSRPLAVALEDGATWTLTVRHSHVASPPSRYEPPPYTAVFAKRVTWRGGPEPTLVVTPAPAGDRSDPPGVEASQTLDVPIVLRVDHRLAPLGIVNLREVRVATERLVSRGSGGSTRDLDRARALLPDVVDLAVQALTVRELGYVSRGQGLTPGRQASAVNEYPNPFGGEPVRYRETVSVDSYDAEAGRATATWRMSSDLKALVDGAGELARRADAQTGARGSPPPMGAVAASGLCRYAIELASGLATDVWCILKVSAQLSDGPHRIEDDWHLTQSSPVAR